MRLKHFDELSPVNELLDHEVVRLHETEPGARHGYESQHVLRHAVTGEWLDVAHGRRKLPGHRAPRARHDERNAVMSDQIIGRIWSPPAREIRGASEDSEREGAEPASHQRLVGYLAEANGQIETVTHEVHVAVRDLDIELDSGVLTRKVAEARQ